MDTIVSTNCLTKIYKKERALDGLTMHVKRGEIYGFIGRNGAGKTTCMKILCGLAEPTSGEYSLFGQTGKNVGKMQERIGNLIEMPGLYPYMTAHENLMCKYIAMGIHRKGYIEEILETVGLGDAGGKKVKKFSLGMKQRLGIGMALLGEPDLLLLDEPINGLDPQGIAEMRETIRRLNREKNITIMISSHILEELYKVADTFGIIHKGMLIQEFSRKQLEEKCSDCIRICLIDTRRACTVLEDMGIQNYKVAAPDTIHVYEIPGRSGEINQKLSEQGCMVQSVQIVRESLEEYFLELTGGAANAESD